MRAYISLLLLSGALLASTACSDDKANDDDAGGGGTTATGGMGGEPRDPLPLKVVTWNVHNLIDGDTADGAQFEDSDPQWRDHVSDVANVLNALDADVIVLQEVEHTEILGAVVNELDAIYPTYQVIDANDPRGIDVGVIAKLEPDEVISHQQDTFFELGTTTPAFRYARDALEIRLTFNERKLVLFGVHYKSKDNDNPQKRLAEAQHTRELADSVTADDPSAGVLILGDFNDLPGSPPLNASIGSEPDVYAAIADNVSEVDRWTFNFQGTLELVDHQLASPLLADMVVPDSVRILHGPEVDAASDHAPIIATFNVR